MATPINRFLPDNVNHRIFGAERRNLGANLPILPTIIRIDFDGIWRFEELNADSNSLTSTELGVGAEISAPILGPVCR